MLKYILGKTIGGLMGKEVKGRIKGKDYPYSLSFEDTKLPWKELTKLGALSIIGRSKNTAEFSWDKIFISSEFDGKTSAWLSIGVFNFNHSTVSDVLSEAKEQSKGTKKTDERVKNLKNTDALLKLLRLGNTLQDAVLQKEKVDDVFKAMKGPMDNFFQLYYPEDENTKRISLKTYSKNFYGLESWSKMERGIEGDQWLYTVYIPAGGNVYSIRVLLLFETLKDEVKEEIEQIAHSFRFERAPIAVDELSNIADELLEKK